MNCRFQKLVEVDHTVPLNSLVRGFKSFNPDITENHYPSLKAVYVTQVKLVDFGIELVSTDLVLRILKENGFKRPMVKELLALAAIPTFDLQRLFHDYGCVALTNAWRDIDGIARVPVVIAPRLGSPHIELKCFNSTWKRALFLVIDGRYRIPR